MKCNKRMMERLGEMDRKYYNRQNLVTISEREREKIMKERNVSRTRHLFQTLSLCDLEPQETEQV